MVLIILPSPPSWFHCENQKKPHWDKGTWEKKRKEECCGKSAWRPEQQVEEERRKAPVGHKRKKQKTNKGLRKWHLIVLCSPCFLKWYMKQRVDVVTPWGLHIYDAHHRCGRVLTQTWCAWQRLQMKTRAAHREEGRGGKWVSEKKNNIIKTGKSSLDLKVQMQNYKHELSKRCLVWFME